MIKEVISCCLVTFACGDVFCIPLFCIYLSLLVFIFHYFVIVFFCFVCIFVATRAHTTSLDRISSFAFFVFFGANMYKTISAFCFTLTFLLFNMIQIEQVPSSYLFTEIYSWQQHLLFQTSTFCQAGFCLTPTQECMIM